MEERTCRFLAEAITLATKKHKFHLWAWVFMPNHVHLLIRPMEENYSISDILQTIKQSVSRKELAFIRVKDHERLKLMSTGSSDRPFRLWQEGGGYDRNLTSIKAIKSSFDYIHNNPVKAEIVKNPEDWHWSSYRDWMELSKGVLEIEKEEFPLI
jgi:putative transposase